MAIILISAPAFSYVTNSSHCDNNVLSTYTGPANLTANWTGNTINVTWYDGDTPYDSNQCTYGGNLTMPSSIPQKTGYTFKGWRVRQAASGGNAQPVVQCNVSNLGTMTGEYEYYGYLDETVSSYNGEEGESVLGLTEPGTWAVEMSNGVVFGTGTCEYAICSCDITGYTLTGGSFCPISNLTNVASFEYFVSDDPDTQLADCLSTCVGDCVNTITSGTIIQDLVAGIQ